MSMAERITVIKSIIAAMPVYGMSVIPLPKKVRDQIIGLQSNFLWEGNVGERKMPWIKWEELCRSSRDGGLGFNIALVSKWVWRFLIEKESLWKRVIISRHGNPPWLKEGASRARGRSTSSVSGGRLMRWLRVMKENSYGRT